MEVQVLSRPHKNAINAAVIQLVECHLAKVDAIGSNPIRRSKYCGVYENY